MEGNVVCGWGIFRYPAYKVQAGMCLQLTHLSRMEFPNIINSTSPFPF